MSGMPARFNPRRPTVAVNAALGVALVAGAFWAYETLSGPDTTTAADASVRSVRVQRGTVTKTVSANGTVQSAATASASFVTGGTITTIDVRVGSVVKKGQVLAKVDPAAARRTLAAAQADRDAAGDALERAEAAGSDTSSAENEVEQAKLAVTDAEAGVAGTTLTAPMAGTVTAVNGTIGSSSAGTGSSSSAGGSGASGAGQSGAGQGGTGQSGAGQSGSSGGSSSGSGSSSGFVEIADLTRMQISAAFAEADATKLKEKQVATVTWNALSGTTETAKVTAIDPSATTSNSVVTYGVTLALDKVPAGARVGQTVSVSVTTGSVENATYLNPAAITTVGTRHSVTVLTNGTSEMRPVEIGLAGDEATQITSGVEAGETVVLKTTTTSTTGNTGGFPGGGLPGGGAGNFGGGGNRGGGTGGR
ncbi:HlyD family efflux transporter periplasmic adaptor subunit [Paractinoplanes ferrugineus]|uniref:RND transporter n=2 Tax=Paractinoplanes ferrugineus TaxID=113564 RepID=A0A919MD56_9ACTN|nr:RND transporter [Actinoplanes ferrugineus]